MKSDKKRMLGLIEYILDSNCVKDELLKERFKKASNDSNINILNSIDIQLINNIDVASKYIIDELSNYQNDIIDSNYIIEINRSSESTFSNSIRLIDKLNNLKIRGEQLWMLYEENIPNFFEIINIDALYMDDDNPFNVNFDTFNSIWQSIDFIKNLFKLYQEREELIVQRSQVIKLKQEKIDLYRDFTHTLGNTITPHIIYNIGYGLKNNKITIDEALAGIYKAYLAEEYIKNYNELMKLKVEDPKVIREIVLREIKTSDQNEVINYLEILKKALITETAHLLFSQKVYYIDQLNDISLIQKKSIDLIKKSFLEEIYFGNKDILDWLSKSIGKTQILNLKDWESILIKEGGQGELIISSLFQELVINSFKYAAYTKEKLVDFELNKGDNQIIISTINRTRVKGFDNRSGLAYLNKNLQIINDDRSKEYVNISINKGLVKISIQLNIA